MKRVSVATLARAVAQAWRPDVAVFRPSTPLALIVAPSQPTMSSPPPIVLHYLALPHPVLGRGGCLRCFFYAHKIPFTEKLYGYPDEWMALKPTLAEEAIKHAPFLEIDGKKYSEHKALLKLAAALAKVEVPADPLAVYAQDAVADAYDEWRASWVKGKFGGAEAEHKEEVPAFLKEFETLVKKYGTGEPFISGSKPLWGDSVVFGLLSDSIVTGFVTEEQLKEYPRLLSIYTAYKSIKEVSDWLSPK